MTCEAWNPILWNTVRPGDTPPWPYGVYLCTCTYPCDITWSADYTDKPLLTWQKQLSFELGSNNTATQHRSKINENSRRLAITVRSTWWILSPFFSSQVLQTRALTGLAIQNKDRHNVKNVNRILIRVLKLVPDSTVESQSLFVNYHLINIQRN